MMPTCEHSLKVGAFHDGELSGEERRAFQAHLPACPACALDLKQLEALSRGLAGMRIPQAPPGLAERLYGTVGAARERVIIRMAEVLTAAAAAVLVVCGGLLWRDLGAGGAYVAAAPPWERAAVTLSVEPSASEPHQIAQWIVEDLSSENGHD